MPAYVRSCPAGSMSHKPGENRSLKRSLQIGASAGSVHRAGQGTARSPSTQPVNASGYAEIDASFTNIKNLDRNRDHSVTSIRFDDVPVLTDGTFQAGVTGNRIQGGFYGPSYAETAGTFEQSNVVGAFGAKR